MRARRRRWTQGELDTNKRILNDAQNNKGKWNEYFENQNDIHVEIGCGKGRFIAQTATKSKDVNHIAIEREPEVIVVGARDTRETDCSLAFIVGDAEDLLDFFSEGEVSRIYLNFSDPWPGRKKWHKRRLTHRKFLEAYARILKPGGDIHFKTDNRELFEFSLNEFCDCGWRLKNICLDLHNSSFEDNIMTEYEEKFSNRGFLIHRLEATPPKEAMEAMEAIKI